MTKNSITVVIYPNQRGMGYVICEHPNDIINYGLGKLRVFTPVNYVKRLSKFIKNYRPDVVILKDYNPNSKIVSKRVRKVIEKLEMEAEEKGLEVYRYRRSDIAHVFSSFNATNKFEISRTLVKWYPYLHRFLAPIRTFMMSEHYHMGIFDAFALMYTHFVLTGHFTEKDEK